MATMRSLLVSLLSLSILGALPACNALTGSDDLSLTKDKGGDDDDDPPPPPPPSLVEVAGVTITEVSVYQGVKRTLMQNGALYAAGVPVVANRDALVRVFVRLDGAYNGQPITGRLTLTAGGAPIDVTQTLTGDSNEKDLTSTINFQVPAASVHEDFQYQVLLGQLEGVGAKGTGTATYPANGLELIGATNVGATLKVQLVPVQYSADGSNRLPDTSEEQLTQYKDGFWAMYPVPAVEISVHAPIVWNKTVQAFGSGWDSLLNKITQLRLDENTPQDVYFYGIFNPADSMGKYCSQGCVAGLGNLAGPGDNYGRAAIGLGFTGYESVDTALHEIGHTHGRDHAPCDVSPADKNFPYSNGHIGVWGYNMSTQHMMDPNIFGDIMGYCIPTWISDYTFYALLTRIKDVNGARWTFPAELMDRTYERVQIDGHGGAELIDPVFMHTPPVADKVSVVLETDGGDVTVEGAYYPYSHLDGGVVLFPSGVIGAHKVRIRAEGPEVVLFR